jgi:hypothetical protein
VTSESFSRGEYPPYYRAGKIAVDRSLFRTTSVYAL